MSTPFKNYVSFTKSQRSAIFLLLIVILLLQLFYFFADFSVTSKVTPEQSSWIALQSQIDSMKLQKQSSAPAMYPFNPNFISDFKGYKLGMTLSEIDRLLEFRKQNKFVNSAAEFQKVTKVSDSLLARISPFFKFPKWTQQNKSERYKDYSSPKFDKAAAKEKIPVLDINLASQEDLMRVYGIGPAISERILKEKEKFGAFASIDQMQFIWGLSPEVMESLTKYFKVSAVVPVKKLRINEASVKELAQFPYFRYALAKEIVTFRSMNGKIRSSEDLAKINGFPVEKINIITLYLDF